MNGWDTALSNLAQPAVAAPNVVAAHTTMAAARIGWPNRMPARLRNRADDCRCHPPVTRRSICQIPGFGTIGTYAGLVTSDPGWQRPEDSTVRPASARLVDPEDELGSVRYGYAQDQSQSHPQGQPVQPGGHAWEQESGYHPGQMFGTGGPVDTATTRIPPYAGSNAVPSGPPSTAYGLIGNPEPLPYVQPHSESTAAPVEIVPGGAELKAAGRRGTQDLGLLLLRLVLGVVFIAHGLQKAFGWWGGEGLDGFRSALSEAGYQHAGVLTYVGAGIQIAAGVLLVLGLFTPLAAAAALGFLANGVLVEFASQRKDGTDGAVVIFGSTGAEYLLVLTLLAAAVILCGPGRYGFDAGRGWARRPFIGSAAALVLGAGGGIAAWFFLHGTNPFA